MASDDYRDSRIFQFHLPFFNDGPRLVLAGIVKNRELHGTFKVLLQNRHQALIQPLLSVVHGEDDRGYGRAVRGTATFYWCRDTSVSKGRRSSSRMLREAARRCSLDGGAGGASRRSRREQLGRGVPGWPELSVWAGPGRAKGWASGVRGRPWLCAFVLLTCLCGFLACGSPPAPP